MADAPPAKRAKTDDDDGGANGANGAAAAASTTTAAITEIAIDPADDWHHHLRDGVDVLANLVPMAARQFRRAIAMPNLKPPVTTTAMALAYRARILAAVPAGVAFEPLMTLYLTDNTPADEIRAAKASGKVFAVKLYPNGATTNSDSGVTDWRNARAALNVGLLYYEIVPKDDAGRDRFWPGARAAFRMFLANTAASDGYEQFERADADHDP